MNIPFLQTLNAQMGWSKKTFGPGLRTLGLIEHISSELEEIKAEPTDLEEWVDVMILAFDGAWRLGNTPEEVLEAYTRKMSKNFMRKWPPSLGEDHAIMHIKEAPVAEGEID